MIHLWSINKRCQLVDLLSRLKSVEEHWGHARSTNRTASDKVHTSTVSYPGVVFWNLPQKKQTNVRQFQANILRAVIS